MSLAAATAANQTAMGIGPLVGGPGLGQHVFQPYTPEFPPTPWTMLYHASVEKAENGYILKVTHAQGQVPKIYIAATTEELQRVFIAAIVAERVSK